MAREAYRSLYGDLTKLKDDSVLKDPAAGPDDDDELFELLLAVSDWVDHYCNRHFYPRVETLLFDGSGGDRLAVPDLIAVSELAQADTAGLSFGKVWEAGDYRLLPHNAAPLQPWGIPTAASGRGRGAEKDSRRARPTFACPASGATVASPSLRARRWRRRWTRMPRP
jgi:hypothetical protein